MLHISPPRRASHGACAIAQWHQRINGLVMPASTGGLSVQMADLCLSSRFLGLKWLFCQQVWVKIVDVRVEYGMLKISCSMKVICLACLSWLVI